MGVQSYEIRNLYSIKKDSVDYLKEYAHNDFLKKYFLVGDCKDLSEKELKYNYIVAKYFADGSCSIVDYVNRKLTGELDIEYNRRKALQKLDTIEFKWECNDMYDDANCCDWKAIEW